MKRIRRITAGSLVGMALVAGIAGIAGAASAAPASTATTGAGVSTTTSNAPPTGSPFTSTPATPSGSSTTAPTGSTPPAPSATPKKSKKSKKKDVLTGAEIWMIVSGHHTISCSHATKELKRVRGADAAISQRLGRWSTRSSVAQKSTATKAKAMASTTGKKVKFFRKLEKKGLALIKRIDAQCGAKTSTS
jgi:hypothetical protein